MTSQTIYWVTRCTAIQTATGVLALLFSTFSLCLFIGRAVFGPDDTDTAWIPAVLRILTPIAIISWLLAIFIPTTKEAAAIYLLPKLQETVTPELLEYVKEQVKP